MQTTIASHFVSPEGGVLMSVIAFSIVFLVIAVLMLMMMALKFFAEWMQRTAPDNSRPNQSAPVPTLKKETPGEREQISPQEEDELAAVITAAIAFSSGRAVKIASFAPVADRPQTSAWKVTGRIGNLEGFTD
ncbi:MAG: OadG family protein [Synergistaceae bacterium]|jgi:Na+-transporting methylmalonyl-CoA/oxaloacetate decarboxylase gamma subunit|nr:OadG family protein [Synergistaceae bacterium]